MNDDLSPEEIALVSVAENRRKIAADEALTGERGPVSAALRSMGIVLGPASVEAVLEMMYWDGVASGLRAAHSSELRTRLMDSAFRFPGFEDR